MSDKVFEISWLEIEQTSDLNYTPFQNLFIELNKTGLLNIEHYLMIRDISELSQIKDYDFILLLIICLIDNNKGSICLHIEQENIEKKLKTLKQAKSHASSIIEKLKENNWSTAISSDVNAYYPLILHQVKSHQYLYFQKDLNNALKLDQLIHNQLKLKSNDVSHKKLIKCLTQVIHNQAVFGDQMMQLNQEQILSLIIPFLQNFLIVSGGPGTGKTSIVSSILRTATAMGYQIEDIALVAPTGRAAQRLTESLHGSISKLATPEPSDLAIFSIEGQTIHRLLRYNPGNNGFIHNQNNKLPCKLLIVDEVSMVDVALMRYLLEAVKEDIKIVFLGDKNQLPAVDSGAVLSDLIPEYFPEKFNQEFCQILKSVWPDLKIDASDFEHELLNHVVILEKSYRNDKSISDICQLINESKPEVIQLMNQLDLSSYKSVDKLESVNFLELKDVKVEQFHHALDIWLLKHYLKNNNDYLKNLRNLEAIDLSIPADLNKPQIDLINQLFDHINASQILSIIRKGLFGSEGINQYINSQLQSLFDRDNNEAFYSGQKVIIQRNDPARNLFNGDIGLVVRQGQFYRVLFKRMDSFLSYSIDSLEQLDSAFAITVHKSQGSEYRDIMLALPTDPKQPLLSKEIVYTAITRAKKSALIIGLKSVLERSIEQFTYRETGIHLWDDINSESVNRESVEISNAALMEEQTDSNDDLNFFDLLFPNE